MKFLKCGICVISRHDSSSSLLVPSFMTFNLSMPTSSPIKYEGEISVMFLSLVPIRLKIKIKRLI